MKILLVSILAFAIAAGPGASAAAPIADDQYDPSQQAAGNAGFGTGTSSSAGAVSPALSGLARSNQRLGGRLETMIDGKSLVLPTLALDVHADIAGDLATVTVVQMFTNPSGVPLNATYVFPLNEEAAVFEMVMMVGQDVVRAEIRQVDEARRTFEAAKRAGKNAALLCEHRPNLFTQEIANLMPELPVTVTLRYVQPVPHLDDHYELVMPLVVGPRFVPPQGEAPAPAESPAQTVAGQTQGPENTWQLDVLPQQAPVLGLDVPDTIDPGRVSFSAYLDGGMPVASVDSLTHPLRVTEVNPNERRIELAEDRIIDNRDLVLRYQLAGASVQAGVLAHHDDRGGFFSVLLEPPAVVDDAIVTPREMVFVLDCSGSMSGLPIEAGKAFMREALRRLGRSDTFRIIRFSDAATEFSTQPRRQRRRTSARRSPTSTSSRAKAAR